MKHKNLQILSDHGINVPKFIVVREGEHPDLSFSDAARFAVRSSFSMEDDAESSFAGQFDSFLNVERCDVADTVRKVVDSMGKQTIQAYKSAKSIRSVGEMCVIVQEMVDAELSGVLFTANPLGILNETVAVIGEGLGCNVVEDKVCTTSYFYNRDDDIYYFEQQEGAPLLSEEMLSALIDVSEQIKSIFSYEADIEFAIKDGTVYILQTRPITTLGHGEPIILDNSNIVESYPGVSLPLTQDFVKSVYHGIFYKLVLRITKDQALVDRMDKYLADMTDIANGRIYYRISNWYAVLKLLPFSGKLIPMWQSMMGVSHTLVASPDDIEVPLRTKLTVLRSFWHYHFHAPKYMDALNDSFASRFEEYQAQVASCENPDELLAVYRSIKESILGDWDLTLVNDMYTFVHTALAGKKNKELIADVKNLESMKPVMAINRLVETAKAQGIDSAAYAKEACAYIECYGDRCLNELKLETRTYRTDPKLLDEYVAKRMTEKAVVFDRHTPERVSRNPYVKRAKIGIRNREISRMNRSRIFGLSRTIFLKIGAYLAKHDQIDHPRDVFYLRMDELDRKGDLREVVKARRTEMARYEKVAPYSRLVFADRIVHKSSSAAEHNVLHGQDVLYGIASSVGKVTGEVLVVDSPDDKLDTTGKILVAKSTDPGWVFLIQGAIGIIAEKGSLLSHTAIISRELHKPAVVNVKDCTKLLHSGDLVELDAYDGTVTLLKH